MQSNFKLEGRAEAVESLTVTADGSAGGLADSDSSLGARVIKGSVWMIGTTSAAKALGFACQLGLAWFLTQKDYGVYAIAISLSVMLSVLRDGGLPMVLEQKARQFDLFAGPVFWMMLAINVGTAITITLAAGPAARFYNLPELAGVIKLFAWTIPLGVIPSVLTVRLMVNLKYRQLSIVQIASTTIRNALLVWFAWSGFGARSFLLPLLITNVIDSVVLWIVTRYPPWMLRPRFSLWPELFRSGRWVMLGTFAIALGNNGAYFFLGSVLPSEIVGTYFFAYQIVVQLGTLLSDNVYQVLVPGFVRMGTNVTRIRAAIPPALSVVVLVGAVASLSIAAIYEPLERALWHGKWAASGEPIYVLAAIWPAAAGVSVLRALQMATGRFRSWGTLTMISALASICGTVAGAEIGKSAISAAVGFGAGALIGAMLNAGFALSAIGLPARDAVRSILPPWLTILFVAALSAAVGNLVPGTWPRLAAVIVLFAAMGVVCLWFCARGSLELLLASMRHAIQGGILNRWKPRKTVT